jgi:nitrogen fixation-related uncharacterized protein
VRRSVLIPLALIASGLSAVPAVSAAGVLRAGVGVADATWHVGVGSGQYTDKDPNAAHIVIGDDVDPHNHSNTQRASYGVQSRLTYRALVVEGSNGERVAFVKSDAYLAQDYLTRRVGQILDANGTSGIEFEDIILSASHNHSSPYYFTPSWGVWLFQDVFEIRAFEYHARQIASAIEQAAASLVPVRMSGTTIQHRVYKGNIAGTTTTDDGSPGGYPDTHADFGVSILRFDDVTSPSTPKPLAVYVNHGQHPESLDGYDLITADFLAPLERFIDRETGATTIFSQGDVGSAEGPYFRSNPEIMPDGNVRAWAHVGHAQTERGARYLANDVIAAWNSMGNGQGTVPWTTDAPVAVKTVFMPGPLSHPYPSVSNCRTEPSVEGRPGAPILGLPDCAREGQLPVSSDPVVENLKAHGLPVPEHYDAPAFTGVEENLRMKLQVARVGDVVFASCSCEAQMDLIRNLESRLDRVQGNMDRGFDWSATCSAIGGGNWRCVDPTNAARTWTITDAVYQRMRAQINNPADGWDAAENTVSSMGEPADPNQILGNFSSSELSPSTGYGMAIGLGHTGDYVGYVVSYREYMSRDHYRKALTAFGPHTADWMNSRLVEIAGELNGGPARTPWPHEAAFVADEARQVAMAQALGVASSTAFDAWQAALPSDVGPAAPLVQPEDITRFDATEFSWRGGSNAVDNPVVRVERKIGSSWVEFADQSGEIQTRLEFPDGVSAMTDTYTGAQEWIWTANFEAFAASAPFNFSTPAGEYRFVAEGIIRDGGVNRQYTVASDSFTVSAWNGLTLDSVITKASSCHVNSNTCHLSIRFKAKSTYPRSYQSSFRYISDDGNSMLCKTCTFRPWASGVRFAVSGNWTSSDGDSGTTTVVAPDSLMISKSYERGSGPIVFTFAPGALVDPLGERNSSPVTVTF